MIFYLLLLNFIGVLLFQNVYRQYLSLLFLLLFLSNGKRFFYFLSLFCHNLSIVFFPLLFLKSKHFYSLLLIFFPLLWYLTVYIKGFKSSGSTFDGSSDNSLIIFLFLLMMTIFIYLFFSKFHKYFYIIRRYFFFSLILCFYLIFNFEGALLERFLYTFFLVSLFVFLKFTNKVNCLYISLFFSFLNVLLYSHSSILVFL